jgi:exonuclease 1
MKKGVEKDRDANREENRKKAQECLEAGDEKQAIKYFSMSIDITPKMAHTLILALRELQIEYYVAPYEADAQLAHLFKSGHVDIVFTEDSDLLAFGVTKCFFKMDNMGNGQEVDLDELKKVKCFKSFTHEMFMTACILSGCDYLDSIKGIGFKKAVKLVDDAGQDNTFLEVMTAIRGDGKLTIPKKYEKKFRKAFLTFKFQRVFCPKTMQLVHVEVPETSPHGSELKECKSLDFLGKDIPAEMA